MVIQRNFTEVLYFKLKPRPETSIEWTEDKGFVVEKQVDLPPYRYGIIVLEENIN